MEAIEEIGKLADKYFSLIEIESAYHDNVVYDVGLGCDSSPGVLIFAVPNEMLTDYARLRGLKGRPNAKKFWNDTMLFEKLREYKLEVMGGHGSKFEDVLDVLGGDDVRVEYSPYSNPEKKTIIVTEV
jgi:hypothetical protein